MQYNSATALRTLRQSITSSSACSKTLPHATGAQRNSATLPATQSFVQVACKMPGRHSTAGVTTCTTSSYATTSAWYCQCGWMVLACTCIHMKSNRPEWYMLGVCPHPTMAGMWFPEAVSLSQPLLFIRHACCSRRTQMSHI